MKRLLLLMLCLSLFVQLEAQHQLHSKTQQQFQQEIESYKKQLKDKSIQSRNFYKQDSIYLYTEEFDNLELKGIFTGHNSKGEYSLLETFRFENQVWTPELIIIQEFDSQENLLNNTFQVNDIDNGTVVNFFRTEFEYDGNNNQIIESGFYWDSTDEVWIIDDRTEFFYSNDDLILVDSSYWDPNGNGFELSEVTTYTHVDGNLTEWITVSYLNAPNISTRRTEVFLDSENQRDSTYEYGLNVNTMEWDLIWRTIYPDDTNAPTYNFQTDLNSSSAGGWDPRFRTDFTRFTDIDEVQFKDEYESGFGTNEFVFEEREEFFVSANPLDLEDPVDSNISLEVANPFNSSDLISIENIDSGRNTTFSLFDLSGNILMKVMVNQDYQFSINREIPSGMYIMSLSQNNQVVLTKKVMKVD